MPEERAERFGAPVRLDVGLRRADDLQGPGLALVARGTPGSDPVAAEDHPDRVRMPVGDRGDVEGELEAGAAPGHPEHPPAEAGSRQRLTVRRRGKGDPGVGMEVIDVGQGHEAVHCGIYRGGRAALAMKAEVEGGDHLVFALFSRIDVHERP